MGDNLRSAEAKKKCILVTGASGLLGRAVGAQLKAHPGLEVIGIGNKRDGPGLRRVDLLGPGEPERLISTVRPAIVIHCAAERRPDVVEIEPETTRKLNVDLPAKLSLMSCTNDHPFALIYISTDYVFSGHPPRSSGYEPGDEVSPTNAYSRSKEEGEVAVRKTLLGGGKGTILRVPILYGATESNEESAVNILSDIVENCAKNRQQVKMDHWATRYPTNVSDVARVLAELSHLLLAGICIPDTLHYSAQNPMTKYEICILLARLHSPPLDISAMVADTGGPKSGETVRPKDCHLSNLELIRLGVDTSTISFESWWKHRILQRLSLIDRSQSDRHALLRFVSKLTDLLEIEVTNLVPADDFCCVDNAPILPFTSLATLAQ